MSAGHAHRVAFLHPFFHRLAERPHLFAAALSLWCLTLRLRLWLCGLRLCRLRLCLWDRFVLSLHTAGAWRTGLSAASADPPGAQI
jgi:hypothetical protein